VEDEVVVPLARIAGLPAAPTASAAFRPLDAVTAHIVLVAGVHHLALAALPMAEHRLGDVALGDVDVFPLRHVADAAAVDSTLHRLADLLLVAAQKALAVADGLVLSCKPPVDDLLEHAGLSVLPGPVAQELLRTRKYHSHNSLTCFGV